MIDEQEQRVTEGLILWGARTAQDLAFEFDADRDAILEMLRDLSARGLVRTHVGHADGDLGCCRCGLQLSLGEAEIGDHCGGFLKDGDGNFAGFCAGYFVDNCFWVYCGGPISQALAPPDATLSASPSCLTAGMPLAFGDRP